VKRKKRYFKLQRFSRWVVKRKEGGLLAFISEGRGGTFIVF